MDGKLVAIALYRSVRDAAGRGLCDWMREDIRIWGVERLATCDMTQGGRDDASRSGLKFAESRVSSRLVRTTSIEGFNRWSQAPGGIIWLELADEMMGAGVATG